MLRIALLVAVVIVGGAAMISWDTSNAHWMQRGGALLASLAALMAVGEATLERRAEEHAAPAPRPVSGGSAFGRSIRDLSERVSQTRFRSYHTALSERKVRAVFINSMIAVCGELLHGFGDLLLVGVLSGFGIAFGAAH